MKLVMLCGVPCTDRETCLEKQKQSLDNYVVVDQTTKESEILQYVVDKKNIIWDQLNLYPEVRQKRLSLIPKDYHKTAIYFKPTTKEIESKNLGLLNMQFVSPTEFENFDCIMRYI